MAQTLDQQRASHAWRAIERLQAEVPEKARQKEYGGEAKKLPIRIIASGLGQALAFIRAKIASKPTLERLDRDLTEWVLEGRGLPGSDRNSLIHSVIEGDTDFLRWATDEVLAYLNWLNRFAEAERITDTEGV